MTNEFFHPHAPIELRDGANNSLVIRLRLREPHGILEFMLRNVDLNSHPPMMTM